MQALHDSTPGLALGSLDEAGRAEFWACLALRHAKNLGARSIRRLLDHFGSARAALFQVSAWPEAGVSAHRAADILSNAWREAARPEWNAAKNLSGRILLWTDPAYPTLLRELPDAPALLYTRGSHALLAGPCLALVGKRSCSPEGLRAAQYFATELSRAGVTVVSGMALGVDQAAHHAARHGPGSTIAVLGTGLDTPYPRTATTLYEQLCEEALVVSEFAPGTKPFAANFPVRNRLISGLSLGVLVIEAAPKSGSLITARLALEQNRSVFAVPGALGAPTAQGCQELIRQGAKPVFAVHDILVELFPHLREALRETLRDALSDAAQPDGPPQAPLNAPPDKTSAPAYTSPRVAQTHQTQTAAAKTPPVTGSAQAKLVALLSEKTALSIDTLDDCLELSSAELSALLIRLEVRGIIRKLPGQYYALPCSGKNT